MKRYIKSASNIEEYSFVLEVHIADGVQASTDGDLINTADERMLKFEIDLLELMSSIGYQLEDEYASNRKYKGQPSRSHYYIFYKVDEVIQKRVEVDIVRLSDHELHDVVIEDEYVTGLQRARKFSKDKAKSIADRELGPEGRHKDKYIQLILNGENISSFEQALAVLKGKIQ